MPPIVASPQATSIATAKWRHALLELTDRPRARQAFRRLRIERFAVPPPDLYDSTRTLYSGDR
jgi:hypothetical protein